MPLDLLGELLPLAVRGDDRLEVGALLGQPGEVLAAAHDRGVDEPFLQIDVAALDVFELVQHGSGLRACGPSIGGRVKLMDMWKAFRNSTKRHAPQASILFDKFHVMRHLGDALDTVRKSEYRRLQGQDRQYIKGQKYTLLSHRENLTLDGRRALKKLLAANKRLNTAYLLKESFGQLWDYRSEGWARRFFENWKAALKWQKRRARGSPRRPSSRVQRPRGRPRTLLLLHAVLAPEALDAASRVDQLLLAGEEGMTRRADVDVQLLLGRAGLEGVPAGTDGHGLVVGRMNAFLHRSTPKCASITTVHVGRKVGAVNSPNCVTSDR